MNENRLFGIRSNETGDTSWFTEDDVYAAAQKGVWEDCTELISVWRRRLCRKSGNSH
jgi:hypothetical protein